MHMHMAWRNLWRNTRRTAIIVLAIVIGVWCMVFFNSLSRGMLAGMLENGVKTLTGHILVQARGFRDDPVVDLRIQNPDQVAAVLEANLPPGGHFTGRVRVGGVAQNARHSGAVQIVGMDPASEGFVSFLTPESIVQGEYLSDLAGDGILVGQGLLDDFETKLGRRIVLMSQGLDGEIESRAFTIQGVFRAEISATEKGFVFIGRRAAQEMLGLGDAVSQFSCLLQDMGQVDATLARLEQAFAAEQAGAEGLEILGWKQALPMMKAYLEMFDSFAYLWFVVVFIAMGFGIVNTTLMAVLERIREFGLFKALGMRPWSIVRLVLAEAGMILVLGIILGNILGAASVLAVGETGINLSALSQGSDFLGMSRILYPVFSLRDMLVADGVVLVLGLAVSLYPALKAARITPVEAFAHT